MAWRTGKSGGGGGGGGVAIGPRQVVVTGNSYAEGGGTNLHRSNRFTRIAAAKLGAAEFSYAKDGSVFVRNSDTAGWRPSLLRLKPRDKDGAVRVGAPYLPPVECAVLCRNMNDLMLYGPAGHAAVREAYRSEIVRTRTGALWAADAAGWTAGGGHAGTTLADGGASDGRWFQMAAGNWVERTTPADWPGGTGHFMLVTGNADFGGSVEVSVDGQVVAARDLTPIMGLTPGYYFPVTLRFPVAAGAHVVRIRQVTGSGVMNLMGLEAPSPGLVVVCQGHRLTDQGVADYTSYGSTGGVPWVAAVNVLAQNEVIRQVAAEFSDGRVVPFNMDAVVKRDARNIAADRLHPSELGHARLGDALARLIAARFPSPWPERPQFAPLWHIVSDPVGYSPAVFTASGFAQAGFAGYETPRLRRDAQDMVHWDGLLGPGGAGSLMTAMEGFRPAATKAFPCRGSTATGTVTVGSVIVGPDGGFRLEAPLAVQNAGVQGFIHLESIRYRAAR